MWALFKSIMNYLYGLLVRVATVKFFIFTAVYWLLTKLYDIAKAALGDTSWFTNLPNLITGLPSDWLFYLKLFRLDVGLPMIIAAYVVKFTIRRLPIIG